MPGPVYLEGETVNPRTIEREDLDFLQEMINHRELWEGFGAPGPRNRAEMEAGFEDQNTGEPLLICRDGDPVGRVRFVDVDETWGTAERTCFVAPGAQNDGVATEACAEFLDYGFQYLPVTKVAARVFESNEGSRRLAESLGFTREGILRDHVYHAGEHLDFHVYGLLEREWDETE